MEARIVLAGDGIGEPSISDLVTSSGDADDARLEFIERYRQDDLQAPDPIPNWWSAESPAEAATAATLSAARSSSDLTVSAAALSVSSDATDLTGFPIYDSLLYSNKPDLSGSGLKPIQLLTSGFFWTPQELSNGREFFDANLDRVRQFTAFLTADQYAVIDIESWPTRGSEAVVAESIRKFDAVIDVMREVNPNLKLGIYSMVPAREYWIPVLNDNETAAFQAWDNINARLDELAAKVDVIFPSIYTFYPDYNQDGSPRLYERDWWVEYAVENLLQARRYNKPTVAFIWPRYHGGGGTPDPNSPGYRYWMYQSIGNEFWDLILETTSKYADGAVIFDYDRLAGATETIPRPWLDDAPWWLATKEFMNGPPPTTASAETKVYGGKVVGSLLNTHEADGQFEILSEVRYGTGNRTRVEHQWTFDVAGEATEFIVSGYHDSTVETFSFDYSTNGTTFLPMSISLTPSLQEHRFAFPAGITGQITVRLKDSNRVARESIIDKVYLDHLAILNKPAVDSSLPTISINDVTVEEGAAGTPQATFVVRRTGNLTKSTTLSYYTEDETAAAPDDYTSRSPRTLFFGAGVSERTISIPIIDDELVESNETFAVQLQGAIGAILSDGRGIATVIDNDTPPPPVFQPKFFVVDANVTETFPYDAAGAPGTSFDLAAANLNPRGITSFDGSHFWVVDRTANVYVHNAAGLLLGTWKASGVTRASGIATDGNDIWIVDDRNLRVVRYAGAANNPSTPASDPILTGTLNSTASFSLQFFNSIPTDLTTDGSSIWVVDDGSGIDRVFEYSLSGQLRSMWSLANANNRPTGITVDPSGVSDSLWIVDSRARKVFEYADVGGTGSRQLVASFDLAEGNVNPQGIADPPPSVITQSEPTQRVDASLIEFSLLSSIASDDSQLANQTLANDDESDDELVQPSIEEFDEDEGLFATLESLSTTAPTPQTIFGDTPFDEELVADVAAGRESESDASAIDLALLPDEFAQLRPELTSARERRLTATNS